jgi:N-acetyl-anhydromuramyl-L-alanine amidase AmpD
MSFLMDLISQFTWSGSTDMASAQPIADELMPMKGLEVSRMLRLLPGQYIATETDKSLIVLHFTAGSTAQGALASWANDRRMVATAYIVDLDGSVYEVFNPKYWAYALGIKGPGGPTIERRAIQIEMVGWGPLTLDGDGNNLKAWTGKVVCSLEDKSKYVKLNNVWRTKQYFSAFRSEQVEATALLVKNLCEKFNIPPNIPPNDKLNVCDVRWLSSWHGIAGHDNARSDKWDPSPAFPWRWFQERLK